MIWLLFVLNAYAEDCSSQKGCQARFCEDRNEIAEAEKKGHKERAASIKERLERNMANCSDKTPDDQLKEDLLKKQIEARQIEVQDARDNENPTKEMIKQMRLDEEKKELIDLQGIEP